MKSILLMDEHQKKDEQNTAAARRIVLTKDQVKDVKSFKEDLKKDNVEFAFCGTFLETVAFLEGAKDIVESLRN